MPRKYTPKSRLDVRGSMSKKDAGEVGRKLADASLILARCIGLAAVIFAASKALVPLITAIRWW